MNTNFFVAWSN